MPTESRADALLELGCEEIPVDYIRPALEQMRKTAETELAAARLDYQELKIEATPRRMVLTIKGLCFAQPDDCKELLGPQQNVAYQADGSLTPAGQGFLKKAGLQPKDTQIKDGRLWAQVQVKGQPAGQLLPEIFMKIIRSLRFPKTMRWESTGVRFARPVRWLTAMLDDKIIPLQFGDVKSGRQTRLHPMQSQGWKSLTRVAEYRVALEAGWVTLEVAARRQKILELLNQAAEECSGELIPDPELLDMVTMMAEAPRVIAGRFKEKYLSIPKEIIVTAMREHQRFFAVRSSEGREQHLLPFFLAIHDNPLADGTAIRPGNEHVLEARLKDAQFFYQEDLKKSLVDRVPELKRVLWIQGLGNLHDRTERIVRLAESLAKKLEPQSLPDAARAAYLAKADLISLMIQEKEFNCLQGIMGGYYARQQHETEAVAQAIAEQYLPQGADDELPRTPAGRILALADKIDQVLGCWAAGFSPTGAKDPYALRRAVQGIIAITLDAGYRYSLSEVLSWGLQGFPQFADQAQNLIPAIKNFFQGRLETELINRQIPPDFMQAVLGVWWDDIMALVAKAQTLYELRKNAEFNETITTFSRVVNILPKTVSRQMPMMEPELPVDAGLFSVDAEKSLNDAMLQAGKKVSELSMQGDFQAAFQTLGKIKPAVDVFFDQVLVMDKDEQIRQNRLNLLTNLARKIWSLADFSKIVVG